MDHFYSELVRDGRYLSWLSEYSTPTQTIGNGTFAGSFVISDPKAAVDQAGIGAILDHEIHVGRLPNTSVNTVYMVHVAPHIPVVSGAAILGLPVGVPPANPGWCAMHVAYTSPWTGRGYDKPSIVYAVLPNVPSCGQDLDSQTELASHELIEAITDPMSVVFSESFLYYSIADGFHGWTDPARNGIFNPFEIADSCSKARLRTSKWDDFLVSQGFSNRLGRCFSPFP